MNLRKDPFEVPFGHTALMTAEEISIENLPDFEIRVRSLENGEEVSHYYKAQQLLKPHEQRLIVMDKVEEAYLAWLKLSFPQYEPVDYKSWEVVAAKLVEFFFEWRLGVEKPAFARGSAIYLSAFGFTDSEAPSLHVQLLKDLTFRSSPLNKGWIYDRFIQSGAFGGHATIFGARQMILVEHRFVNLSRLFFRDSVVVWAINRLNKLLPGIVDKKLITEFQWLQPNKYFGGDQPAKNPMKK